MSRQAQAPFSRNDRLDSEVGEIFDINALSGIPDIMSIILYHLPRRDPRGKVDDLPGRGLEPLRIAPPDPKSGASANFATLAAW